MSVLAAIWLSAFIPVAQAGDAAPFPARTVRLVVGFSGGTNDSLARLVADQLERALGQPVVVELRTGASGNIASEFVARAAPDGYTLMLATVAMTILPSLQGPTAVDPVRSFAAVTRLATHPIMIVANPSLGVTTLSELVSRARGNPGGIAYATAGIGTTPHLAAAELWSRAKVELLHVPYANPSQVMKDVIAAEVPVAFILAATAEPFVKSGHLKALAVTSPRRLAAIFDVPTVSESGFPGFDLSSWYGIVAPAGTPRSIIDRLHDEIVRILQSPIMRERLAAMGGETVGNTPDQFAAEIRAEVARWPAIVKATGIVVER